MIILDIIAACVVVASYLGIGAATSHVLTEDYTDKISNKSLLILARCLITLSWPIVLPILMLIATISLTYKVIVR